MCNSTITIDEQVKWDHVIKSSHAYDFHHTSYYHIMSADSNDPLLFLFESDGAFIAIPLLKRKIEGTAYFDCTSVYGYAGPVSNIDFADITPGFMNKFLENFYAFLKEENIVSVFTRLNPLIHQHFNPGSGVELYDNGQTVVIDLRPDITQQRMNYRKAFRSKINQLRNKGYTVRQATSAADVAIFTEIYTDNMMRLSAGSNYFYDADHFLKLLHAEGFSSHLLLACYDGKVTGGVLTTCCNQFMQLHLAATHRDFLHDSPMRLLIEEASILGKEAGMQYLQLGGGVGGNRDSLFEFKAGFSDYHLPFKTWRLIADINVYKMLLLKRTSHISAAANVPFPGYRFDS
ncbi:MAG TPA: GNAT family N-acetyltransferase [Chitinophaga sp.]|uniref:GNAT family N-acetyltransferase n=1 Tax=Chitinophaga sp. TaxID=1869181 RepID=UPI002C5F3B10|nr:GNAT family N-acetyltransferase [Chitinophaga sp.]HVI47496.1 GNAT family N-acetyltransferase [Chitinophaga sp.]